MEESNKKDGITVPKPVFNERRQESWKSKEIDQLGKSLAIAQSTMKGAKKNSVNPFFKSNYADLHTVIESSLPHLIKVLKSVK